jgi:hypothetical protein
MAAVADSFEGTTVRAPWSAGSYRLDLLVQDPPVVSGGYVDLELDVGGAGGSHWFDNRIGALFGQLLTGDFDVAVDLQVFDQAGTGLPPSTGAARLGVLAAHDPDRATVLNYVHRGVGRAPGGSEAGDGIVDEDKSTVNSVSVWDTRPALDTVTCRCWVRMRRVGSTFTTWVSLDGATWSNEISVTRADLPSTLEVGVAPYATDADANLRVRVYSFVNVPVVSATALPYVALEVDGITNVDDVAARIGSASDTLTPGAEYLVFVRGNARSNSNGIDTTLDLRIGGTIWGRTAIASPPFGAPAYGATDSGQLAFFALVTAGASDEMEFFSSDSLGDASGLADVCRAYAVDVSELVADEQRWHQQTANSDTIVTTPTSGWTTVGSTLVVTAPRTGYYVLLTSGEYVADGTEADTDQAHVRVTQDGTTIPGSIKHSGLGFGGVASIDVGHYARPFRRLLTAGVEYTFALQANGTSSGGNLGWRRVRLHLIDAAAIEDGDVVQGEDTAGLTVAAGATADADADVELAPPGLGSYLVLTGAQGQFSAWPRTFITANGDLYPAGVDAANGTGTGAGSDMTTSLGLQLLPDVAGVTVGLRVEAAAGGVQNLWGADAARTDDGTGGGTPEGGPIHVIAIRLALANPIVDAAVEFGPTFDMDADGESIIDVAVEFGPAFDMDAAATVIVDAAVEFGPRFNLRIARALAGSVAVLEGADGESTMQIAELMQAAGAARGMPAPTTVALNASTQQVGPVPPSGRGRLIVLGGLRCTDDTTVEVWDGTPDGGSSTLIDTLSLTGGQPMPMALWGYYSTGGRGLFLRVTDAVDVTGRLHTIEI